MIPVDQRDRIHACFTGALIGDAFGMPVEGMKPKQIALLNGGRGVVGFMDPSETSREMFGTDHLVSGDTTDDWQLTKAVARSLIRNHGDVNVADMASEHVRALADRNTGWGGTTERAIKDIRDGRRDPVTDLLPEAVPGKGAGNGIMMKVSPLAVVSALETRNTDSFQKDCISLGSLTHPGVVPSITAFAVGNMMARAVRRPFDGASEALGYFNNTLIPRVRHVELNELNAPTEVSDRLKLIESVIHDPVALRNIQGYMRFHCMYTLTITMGTFLRHPCDFRKGLIEIVNHGGDADSNASILGAMIGANVGLAGIPEEWRTYRPWYSEAVELADQLIEACTL
ncbi:MAG: ADP-ribosylglycohydrolase family protein [Patescibacteria group bacterium]